MVSRCPEQGPPVQLPVVRVPPHSTSRIAEYRLLNQALDQSAQGEPLKMFVEALGHQTSWPLRQTIIIVDKKSTTAFRFSTQITLR